MPPLFLLPIVLVVPLSGDVPPSIPSEASQSAPSVPSPIAPSETAPSMGRRVLIDSRVEFHKPEGEPYVLDTPEIRLVRKISLHGGGTLCLFLADPPWHQGPLFLPGYAVPLDRKKEEKKAAAEARKAKEEQEKVEREERESPASTAR